VKKTEKKEERKKARGGELEAFVRRAVCVRRRKRKGRARRGREKKKNTASSLKGFQKVQEEEREKDTKDAIKRRVWGQCKGGRQSRGKEDSTNEGINDHTSAKSSKTHPAGRLLGGREKKKNAAALDAGNPKSLALRREGRGEVCRWSSTNGSPLGGKKKIEISFGEEPRNGREKEGAKEVNPHLSQRDRRG